MRRRKTRVLRCALREVQRARARFLANRPRLGVPLPLRLVPNQAVQLVPVPQHQRRHLRHCPIRVREGTSGARLRARREPPCRLLGDRIIRQAGEEGAGPTWRG